MNKYSIYFLLGAFGNLLMGAACLAASLPTAAALCFAFAAIYFAISQKLQ